MLLYIVLYTKSHISNLIGNLKNWSMVYVCYINFRYANLLWNDHHDKPNNHLSPFKVITMLLSTLFLKLP